MGSGRLLVQLRQEEGVNLVRCGQNVNFGHGFSGSSSAFNLGSLFASNSVESLMPFPELLSKVAQTDLLDVEPDERKRLNSWR